MTYTSRECTTDLYRVISTIKQHFWGLEYSILSTKFAQRFFEGNRSCPQIEWQILASKPKPMPARYRKQCIPICGRRVTFVTEKELIHQLANWDEPARPKRCQNPRIAMPDIYHGLKFVCLWPRLSVSRRAVEFRCRTPAPRVLVFCNKTGQYNFVISDIETNNKCTYPYESTLYIYIHSLVLIAHLTAQCTVRDCLK